MISEVELKVTLQLDYDDPHPTAKLELAAKQAVTSALQFAYDNGFENDLADDVSIGVADVEVVGMTTGCVRCGSDLDADGECTDCTCPFFDHKQNCPAGWNGHPEHEDRTCICEGRK